MIIATGNAARPFYATGTPWAAWDYRHGTRPATDAEMLAEYGCTREAFLHAWRELSGKRFGEWQPWLAARRKGRAA